MKNNRTKSLVKSIFFDLDGTLLDTAKDMAYALNLQLQEHSQPALPFEDIRPHVSHGTPALLKLAFNCLPSDSNFEQLRKQYLDIYASNLAVNTQLFNGLDKLLTKIESHDLGWGIITNKPAFLTEPLIKELNLFERANAVISGDTISPSKPNPLPLFLACKRSNTNPTQAIYIGDARRDIVAGKAAGMKTIIANYGYIQPEDDILSWNGDLIAHCSTELDSLIFC